MKRILLVDGSNLLFQMFFGMPARIVNSEGKEGDATKIMKQNLYIGFKGKNNASSALVEYLSENPYLLTNSFGGLKKDIENLADSYDYVLMFGVDKNLKNSVRIERVAEREGICLKSDLELNDISKKLNSVGVMNCISNTPTHYLCNEAYWFALQKYKGKVVFIHIPTTKNMCADFLEKLRNAMSCSVLWGQK